ncbi:MAG: multi-sensor hybrid histidine kinase [Rhodoferax sp.]|nr:multi-sensor hybrid histidine kinase [Rhodoferax sp.]
MRADPWHDRPIHRRGIWSKARRAHSYNFKRVTQENFVQTPQTCGETGFVATLGASQTARAIAAFDWSQTPLGAIGGWPPPLRTAVSFVCRSPVAMTLLWGREGILVYNQAYAVIAADKHPAALGQSALNVWPEVADFNRINIDSLMAGEAISYKDVRLVLQRHGALAEAWFDLDYSPVFDEAGRPAGGIALVVETTQRVATARRLEEERARFVELFEQAPSFMAVLRGPDHRIELANPGYNKLVGHRPVLGRTVAQALPDAAAQGYIGLLDTVFRTGQAFTGSGAKYAVQAEPNGPVNERYVDFVYQPIKNAAGEVTGIFVEGVDVTDRVVAEAEVRESNTRNRQILDSAIDYAIIATDVHGHVTRWNEGARRTLGWTEDEMLGQDASRFFTPEDLAAGRIRVEMETALARGVANDERWHLRKSGERFWASGEMTLLRGDGGVPVGFVKVLRDRTEQHRAAAALRQSEKRLHRAQEAGGVGTFAIDLSNQMLYGTRQFYRIFGVPESERVPAAIIEALVVPEDKLLRSDAARRHSEAAPLDVEYRIRRGNDGALRWIARKAEFERDGAGKVARMVGVVQDITERRATQQALVDSEAQFRTFAQSLPNHVWTAPPDGLLDWFNDQVYEYSGVERGTLDGAAWADLLHPDDLLAARAMWQQCLTSGALYEAEFRLRRADGAYRWHLARALPLRSGDGGDGGDGGITRWIGTNTDIHERRLAQVESTRDRDRIWTLSQELMLICDFEGVIAAVNPSATRLLGWTADEMVGHVLADFIHPDDVADTAAEMGQLAEGITTLAFENRYRAKDGSYRLLSWTAVPDRGHVHAVARDVTRERAAEEALSQSQKLEAIGQLTGGVAHDFNNVLAVIKASMELLRRQHLAADKRERFMDAISNAVERATRLTGQLLAFARRQALQPEVFDAGHNTRAVSEMIASLTGSRIEIDLRLAAQPCYVLADPTQFDTALINLAVNARDAMPGGGRLTLHVAAADEIAAHGALPPVAGDYVAVSISDTGTGIAPEHLAQIFEPFFTTKGIGQGTGLGLSQVFGFAKQSGGDIRVASVPGQGSRFTLYLPRAPRPGTAAETRTEGRLTPAGGGCVLVVEDNPDVAASVELTLQELGYTTVLTSSAEAALEVLRAEADRFVAVFTDVVMTGMSGVELGHAVRRLYGALPVLLSTGYSYVLAQQSDHGFALLQKPYSIEELGSTLAQVIGVGGGAQPIRHG